MNNEEKLREAGVIEPGATLSPEQSQAIESLTPEEVRTLITIKKKLGNTFSGRSDATGIIL